MVDVNNKCVGCSQCISFCRHDAIKVFGRAEIMEWCTNCGVCLTYCPMRAIEYSDCINREKKLKKGGGHE